MVKKLGEPERPLAGGSSWEWLPRAAGAPWGWCRVYHRATHTPDGTTFRAHGPLHRFDTHEPGPPAVDPDRSRSVLYVGSDLATSAAEVFGETGEAPLCPGYRVALVAPNRALRVHDLLPPGAAMSLGALPSLADGDVARALSQQWARAIQDDEPAGPVDGIRYRSAYYGGEALVLWGVGAAVATVSDVALTHPAMWRRLAAALDGTRILMKTVPEADCPRCGS